MGTRDPPKQTQNTADAYFQRHVECLSFTDKKLGQAWSEDVKKQLKKKNRSTDYSSVKKQTCYLISNDILKIVQSPIGCGWTGVSLICTDRYNMSSPMNGTFSSLP